MNWRRSLIAVLMVLPVIAILAYGLTTDPNTVPSPLPGRDAPDFALEIMDDTPGFTPAIERDSARLAEHAGDVVVLNFWASWCLACRDEHEALSTAARMFEDDDVQFYGMLYNDTPENARRWIRRMGGQSYPVLLDPGARTAISYGLYGVPETFIIGPDGRVAYKHIGPVTVELLSEKIREAMTPQPAAAAPETVAP